MYQHKDSVAFYNQELEIYGSKNLEFEVRFRINDYFIIRELIEKLEYEGGAKEEEFSVNFISQEAGKKNVPSKIKRVRITKSSETGEMIKTIDHYKKHKKRAWLVMVKNSFNYTLVVSEEIECTESEVKASGTSVIRLKLRKMYFMEGLPWRIDITIVRQIPPTSLETIPKMKDEMMKENFLESLEEIHQLYNFELEIEYQGEGPIHEDEINEVISRMAVLIDEKQIEEMTRQNEIYHVATYLITDNTAELKKFEYTGMKRLISQAYDLTKLEYKEIYPPTGYYLLDKADGYRGIVSIRDGKMLILTNKLIEMTKNTAPDSREINESTIIDAEIMYDASGGPIIYAFDVIAIHGENISTLGYGDRIAKIEEAINVVKYFTPEVYAKPIVHITATEPEALQTQFNSEILQNRPYETDGRILVSPNRSYRNTTTYKWKPADKNSIDFLAKRATVRNPDFPPKAGYKLYYLFVGINQQMYDNLSLSLVDGYNIIFNNTQPKGQYFPVQFSPSDSPHAYIYYHPDDGEDIDSLIVEMICADGCKAAGRIDLPDWRIINIRHDRARESREGNYFGNDFRIAEYIWLNYIDPFYENELWEGVDHSYFFSRKSNLYKSQTAFTSFVKSMRIENTLKGENWVVDLAAGKGQDLGRYFRAGVKHLVAVDQDRAALTQLIRRKYTMKGEKNTRVYTLRTDLTDNPKHNATLVRKMPKFPEKGANAAVINLAINYFTGNYEDLEKVAILLNSILAKDGKVIITTMMGDRVFELLKDVETGGRWNYMEDGILKYSIRRDFIESELTVVGQQIGIILPFSGGEYYEEYLVNPATVIEVLHNHGFELTDHKYFDHYFSAKHSSDLNEGDLQYLSLYGELVFAKK